MLYAYQLRAHNNARYQESLLSLSQKELACMLASCGICAKIAPKMLGGAPFLCFEAPVLTPAQRAFLSGHSALYMTAALEGEYLRPLEAPAPPFLPDDMAEILKYKGKTNARFTHLMLNLALSAGGQGMTIAPRVIDPICGRGTTLFCALSRGMHAFGVDGDRKSIEEGVAYTQRWLQYHRVKHTLQKSSRTLPNGKSAPQTLLRVSKDGKEAREIAFLCADTRQTGHLFARQRAHALVADLPYGVQHAPRADGRMSTLPDLLAECLPAWRQALLPGCAAAIAFNTYTLKRKTLEELALQAGFILPESPLYADFSHWVEQAVNRDVLIALQPSS